MQRFFTPFLLQVLYFGQIQCFLGDHQTDDNDDQCYCAGYFEPMYGFFCSYIYIHTHTSEIISCLSPPLPMGTAEHDGRHRALVGAAEHDGRCRTLMGAAEHDGRCRTLMGAAKHDGHCRTLMGAAEHDGRCRT